jgi:hypothetical protein
MASNFDEWSALLDDRQTTFLGPNLNRAVSLLRAWRNEDGGWGAYHGLRSDLHNSALAIHALDEAGDEFSKGMRAQAAIVLRRATDNSVSELSFLELTDLLRVTRCERTGNEEYARKLIDALKESYLKLLAERSAALRDSCSALTVLSHIGSPDAEFLETVLESLLAQQRLDDGSWAGVIGEPGAVLPTAMAIRALSRFDLAKVKMPLTRGLTYVHHQLEENGWPSAAPTDDTYSLAVTLRSLAKTRGAEYRSVKGGIDALVERMNDDGGWGGGLHEPSNVESTALSTLALIAAGEIEFVPARLAKAAIVESERLLVHAVVERNKLREDVTAEVKKQISLVLAQRDELAHELGSMERSNVRLRRQLQKARVDRERIQQSLMFDDGRSTASPFMRSLRRFDPYLADLFQRYVRIIGPIFIVVFGIIAATRFMKKEAILASRWDFAVLCGITLYGFWRLVSFSRDLVLRITRTGLSAGLSSNLDDASEIATLRDRFYELQQSLPPSIREDLVYRLYRDLAELPPEMGDRYSRDLTIRYDLPARDQRLMLRWIEQVLRLGPTDRRVLFDQLRRAVLR